MIRLTKSGYVSLSYLFSHRSRCSENLYGPPLLCLLSIPTIGVMLIVVRTIVDEGLLSLVYCSRELSH